MIPRRGLWKRDPLSPYLFIICAEVLSSLIWAKESLGHIHGCRIAHEAPTVGL